jgi:two-component system chemotaxis response regulator CheB
MAGYRKKIRVLIVDDSALIRKLLTAILNSAVDIEVVGAARDPIVARDLIKKLNPDVLTLDIEMPRMDGISFLSNLMRLRPMPVVMVSSMTEKSADVTLQALELGAIDFVLKPKVDITSGLEDCAAEIIEKVRIASRAKVWPVDTRALNVNPKYSADAVIKNDGRSRHIITTDKIIAIGASTGGTEAIKQILCDMPAHAPGIVITQHIPETFSTAFAHRMDRMSAMTVFEAIDGQQILPGHVYIAPGDSHLMIKRSGARYICKLSDGPPVNRHRPSIDVMFRSIAQHVGPNAIGVVLTGMGNDGAAGLKEIHLAGGYTIIQDEKTSVVWGMPGEAYKLGVVDKVKPVYEIGATLLKAVRRLDNGTNAGTARGNQSAV